MEEMQGTQMKGWGCRERDGDEMGTWEWGCGVRDEGTGIEAHGNGGAGIRGCRMKG